MSDIAAPATREDGLNLGVSVLGPVEMLADCDSPTYVVLGVSRGGTSAIAGLLHTFGIHMGRTGKAPLYEDLGINRALGRGMPAFEERVATNNDTHGCWGFKGNAITQPLADVAAALRTPVFIAVFRDLAAIAGRAKLSANREVRPILLRQAREYTRIVEFLSTEQYPALILSYEKLLAHPADVIRRLATELHLDLPESTYAAAASFIESAPVEYLKVSKATDKPA